MERMDIERAYGQLKAKLGPVIFLPDEYLARNTVRETGRRAVTRMIEAGRPSPVPA